MTTMSSRWSQGHRKETTSRMDWWRHKCSLEWLQARQRHITASDIKSLLPFTKTGRPRKVGDEEMLKVLAGKTVTLTEEDCWSYGVMARGHLLEPYAIKTLNTILANRGSSFSEMYWWDDELVEEDGRSLAFSPDGLDVPMGHDPHEATAIAEVKCYSPAQHLVTAYTPKDKLEERWQIASAMALMPNIRRGYLVLFNPKMKIRKTFVITFYRSELESEIETAREVEGKWDNFLVSSSLLRASLPDLLASAIGGNESDIEREIMERQGLNP